MERMGWCQTRGLTWGMVRQVQLAGLTEAMEAGKQEHAARLDMLAGQIGEEARRRAQAEAKALALYQAHTQAQARAQASLPLEGDMLRRHDACMHDA